MHDLQPLLKFIGFEAASEKFTWNYIVNDFVLHHDQQFVTESNEASCYPELINVLQKCMWRTCKSQIVDELKIPPQEEVIHRIQFSNLEKLFYNEQHSECYTNFLANVQKYTKNMSTISPQIMKTVRDFYESKNEFNYYCLLCNFLLDSTTIFKDSTIMYHTCGSIQYNGK